VTTWLVAPELRYVVGDTTPHAIAYAPKYRAVVDTALGSSRGVRRLVVGPGA
jgi:hypothetical protein